MRSKHKDDDPTVAKPKPQLGPEYDPYILCLEAPKDHPEWRGKEWFIMGGPRRNPIECFFRANASSKQYVADWAGRAAKAYEATYGGQWCGLVREVDNSPYDGTVACGKRMAEAERIVLAGPDTPGRRWLLRNDGKMPETDSILKTPDRPAPPVRVADRTTIDRLREPLVSTGHPLQADEDWFNAESERLRAEEPPVVHVPTGEEIPF